MRSTSQVQQLTYLFSGDSHSLPGSKSHRFQPIAVKVSRRDFTGGFGRFCRRGEKTNIADLTQEQKENISNLAQIASGLAIRELYLMHYLRLMPK